MSNVLLRLIIVVNCCLSLRAQWATCKGVMCLAPYSAKPNAASIKCKTKAGCTGADLDTCCIRGGVTIKLNDPHGSSVASPTAWHAPLPTTKLPTTTTLPTPTPAPFPMPPPLYETPAPPTSAPTTTLPTPTPAPFPMPPPLYETPAPPTSAPTPYPAPAPAPHPTPAPVLAPTTTLQTVASSQVSGATCAQFLCPQPLINKQPSDRIFCENPKACSGADVETCCEPANDVAAASVTTVSVAPQQPSVTTVSVAPQQPSVTTVSVAPQQPSSNRAAVCRDFTCPANMVKKAMQDSRLCFNPKGCTPDDADTCCTSRTTCASFTCPFPTVNKEPRGAIACIGSHGCTGADQSTCCFKPATCASFSCSEPFIGKLNAETISCADPMKCTSADQSTCCIKPATCADFNCPQPLVSRRRAERTFCINPLTCTVDDMSTCCQTAATCVGFTCPQPLLQIPEAATTQCADPYGCEAIDVGTCCISMQGQKKFGFAKVVGQSDAGKSAGRMVKNKSFVGIILIAGSLACCVMVVCYLPSRSHTSCRVLCSSSVYEITADATGDMNDSYPFVSTQSVPVLAPLAPPSVVTPLTYPETTEL